VWWIILATFVLLIAISQIYGYIRLNTSFKMVRIYALAEYSLDNAKKGLINAVLRRWVEAASSLIRGLNIDGDILFRNCTFVPLYLPPMKHKVKIEGKEIKDLVRTGAMLLLPFGHKNQNFSMTILTPDLPGIAWNTLKKRGRIDIKTDSSLSLGLFSFKHSQAFTEKLIRRS
jgi:hypothetical protein